MLTIDDVQHLTDGILAPLGGQVAAAASAGDAGSWGTDGSFVNHLTIDDA